MLGTKKPSSYWGKIFRASLDDIRKTAAIAAGGGGMIATGLALIFGYVQKSEIPKLIFIAGAGAIGGCIFEFVIRILFLTPAKIYKAEQADKKSLTNALSEQIQHKELEIQSLSNRLNEKSEADKLVSDRKSAKGVLADDLRELRWRLLEIKAVFWADFKGDLKTKEWEKTWKLFGKIEDHLTTHLTEAESSIFSIAMPSPLNRPKNYDPAVHTELLDYQ